MHRYRQAWSWIFALTPPALYLADKLLQPIAGHSVAEAPSFWIAAVLSEWLAYRVGVRAQDSAVRIARWEGEATRHVLDAVQAGHQPRVERGGFRGALSAQDQRLLEELAAELGP